MDEKKTEGIVLRCHEYEERHRIITLFTVQSGLVRLIVRDISRKTPHLLVLTSPFCRGEYLYREGRSELLRYHDGTILDDGFLLRKQLSFLRAAGALAQAILTSQMFGHASAALYLLYRAYQQQIVNFNDHNAFLASFHLKVLQHEGLLSISSKCSNCDKPALCLYEGESLCVYHAPSLGAGMRFLPQEWERLLALNSVHRFSALQELHVSLDLAQKVTNIFLVCISREERIAIDAREGTRTPTRNPTTTSK